MKHRRKTTILALAVALCLLIPGGLANAASGNPSNPGQALKDTRQAWLEIKAAALPLQGAMRSNQQAYQGLCGELSLEAGYARLRIKNLLAAAITNEELALLRKQLDSLKAIIEDVRAERGSLGREMALLRGRKADLDKEGIAAAFTNAIAVQAARITLVSHAVELVKAIAAD